MSAGEGSSALMAAKLETRLFKPIGMLNPRIVRNLISELKWEMESIDDRLVKEIRMDCRPTLKKHGHYKLYLFYLG